MWLLDALLYLLIKRIIPAIGKSDSWDEQQGG
jgi:hypothetical protein